MPTLRSGKVLQEVPIKSKGFNLKARAELPEKTNVLVTSSPALLKLAASYGVITCPCFINAPATLSNSFAYQNWLASQIDAGVLPKKQSGIGVKNVYLLLGYGKDYLYFAQAPLNVQQERPNPAQPKATQHFPKAWPGDGLMLDLQWTQPATLGSEKPTREAVMGDSALNYAKSILDEAWAAERKWEWLHVVGRSLGGGHEVGNLVAGTFDANTQMIPYETTIQRLTQKATPTNPVSARYIVELYEGTWVASSISMQYFGAGEMSPVIHIPATTSLFFDRLQFDLWNASKHEDATDHQQGMQNPPNALPAPPT